MLSLNPIYVFSFPHRMFTKGNDSCKSRLSSALARTCNTLQYRLSEVSFVLPAVSRTLYNRYLGAHGSPKGSNLQRMGNITNAKSLSGAFGKEQACRMQKFSPTKCFRKFSF